MKNRLIFCLICFFSFFFLTNVYATNDVDYTLTITKDYEFKEIINYSLSDYKQIENGYNYYNSIVNDDIYTDIFYNAKYKKTKKLSSGIYHVTLSNTYNEYTMSNANFLNNCFKNEKYDYNINHISFDGKGGFNCLYADNIKITIITDFEVTRTNAEIHGNNYVWYPTDNSFTMSIDFNKKYERKDSNSPVDYDDIENKRTNESEKSVNRIDNNQKKHHVNKYVIIGVIGILLITSFCVVIVLKRKNNSLNKI